MLTIITVAGWVSVGTKLRFFYVVGLDIRCIGGVSVSGREGLAAERRSHCSDGLCRRPLIGLQLIHGWFPRGGQIAVLMQPSRGREPEAEPLTARKVAGRSRRFRVVDRVAGACAPAHAERAGWRRMEADANPSTDGGVLASGPSYEIGFGLVGWNDPCLAGDKVTGLWGPRGGGVFFFIAVCAPHGPRACIPGGCA